MTKLSLAFVLALSLSTDVAANTGIIYDNTFDNGNNTALVQATHPAVSWRFYPFMGNSVYSGRLDTSSTSAPVLGATIVNRSLPASYTVSARMSWNVFDTNDFLAGTPKVPALMVFDWQARGTAPHINFRWASVVYDSAQGVHVCLMGEYHDRWELRHAYPGCPVTAPIGWYDLAVAVDGPLARLSVAGHEVMSYTYPTASTGPAGMAVTSVLPLPNNRAIASNFGEGRFDRFQITR